jgi:hypothetical protein
VAAHLAELDEAKQDGDDELWNDICSAAIEVEIGEATWELWFDQDGWTAGRPTYEPEFRRESRAFGDGDLMGRVGPATLSPEEVVRRLVTLEFESFSERINRPKVEPRPGMLGRYAQLAGCRGSSLSVDRFVDRVTGYSQRGECRQCDHPCYRCR